MSILDIKTVKREAVKINRNEQKSGKAVAFFLRHANFSGSK